MSIDQMRAILSWAYLGDRWLDKVLGMSEKQIYATYMSMRNHGKLKGIHDNVSIRTHH